MVRRGSFIGGQDNLSVPDAPTIGAATAGNTEVSVAFTAPSDVGDDPITSFGVSVFPATGTTKTFRVTVASGNLYGGGTGNVFYIDGVSNPALTLVKGFTYVFDQEDSSNSGHPFHFKNSSDSQYTTGVTVSGTAGSSGATVTLVLAEDASEPSAYYCTAHGNGMGNTITLVAPSASDDPLGQAQYSNTGSSSPITVTGLSNGTPYVAKVWAINDYGNGPLSAATSSFTPALARALFVGLIANSGSTATKEINYISIATTGNAADFGDTIDAAKGSAASGSDTRALFYEGTVSGNYSNIISYVTIASLGNAQDFGDISETRAMATSTSNNVRSMHFGGYHYSGPTARNNIEYVTIASTGNSTDYGDLTDIFARQGALGSSTRAVVAGGSVGAGGAYSDIIQYNTIASAGNSIDFGDLTVARTCGALSSSTRGVWGGGSANAGNSNVMDYVTIASTGNAQDFGDLTVARNFDPDGAATSTRGVFAGGNTSNVIDYITIASAGNATDFGDLITRGGEKLGGHCSDDAAVQNESYFPPAAFGVFGLGQQETEVTTIQYINIATTGNSVMFGDMQPRIRQEGGVSSSTRFVASGGRAGSTTLNVIDYLEYASKGKSTDFGDLTVARYHQSSASNSTRGLILGGDTGTVQDVIDYITIASAGNATDFGNLSVQTKWHSSASGTTRLLKFGGYDHNANTLDTIEYVTIASTGDMTDFGDLLAAKRDHTAGANATRALVFGGNSSYNVIQYVTIASTGNATDFGDLSTTAYDGGVMTSSTRAVYVYEYDVGDTSYRNSLEYVTIASTGNTTDFGDFSGAYFINGIFSTSNSHGGIS